VRDTGTSKLISEVAKIYTHEQKYEGDESSSEDNLDNAFETVMDNNNDNDDNEVENLPSKPAVVIAEQLVEDNLGDACETLMADDDNNNHEDNLGDACETLMADDDNNNHEDKQLNNGPSAHFTSIENPPPPLDNQHHIEDPQDPPTVKEDFEPRSSSAVKQLPEVIKTCKIWDGHGGFAEISGDKWMEIPLMKNWEKRVAKQGKIYPLGPAERKLLNECVFHRWRTKPYASELCDVSL
jgi:hypothetical protein